MTMSLSAREEEERLRGCSYGEIREQLRDASDAMLVTLLDAKSVKVGDTAAGLLASRRFVDTVRHALAESVLQTGKGKVRALGILRQFGKAAPGALEAYLSHLRDRSLDVVGDALFGLVFWQDLQVVPWIRDVMAESRPGSARRSLFEKALAALESGNPFIFSPAFCDVSDVWGLDRDRFPQGAAPERK